MELTDRKYIISLLKSENLRAQKRLGQNFLVNKNVLNKIIEAGEIKKTDKIIEIGPGLGTLTIELAKNAGEVITIEKDRWMIELLKKNTQEHKNIKIINQDALTFEPPYKKYKIIANIPYNITSPLLTHFLSAKNKPEKIVFLVQKEVAEKITAKDSDLNILAITVQLFGTPKIICKVGKDSFFPSPKVESAVLKIDIKKDSMVKTEEFEAFIKVVKAGFSTKRKKIINSITMTLDIEKKVMENILLKAGINKDIRPQEISIQKWIDLFRILSKVLRK